MLELRLRGTGFAWSRYQGEQFEDERGSSICDNITEFDIKQLIIYRKMTAN